MARKKTHEEFIAEAKKRVGNEYTVLGKYINTDMPIDIRHNECENVYLVRRSDFLKGKRCPKCSRIRVADKRRKSQEQFVKEVHDVFGDDYSVLGKYKSGSNRVLVRHNQCGYEYEVVASSLIGGNGCRKCAGNIKKTTEQFRMEVYELLGDEYTVIGEYNGTNCDISMRHNKCGCEFERTPKNFLKGSRCRNCAKINRSKSQKKSHQTFIEEVFNKFGDEYSVLGKYEDSQTWVKVSHNKCGHIYDVLPSNILSGKRCPQCSAIERGLNRRKTHEDFVKEIFELVGNEYTILDEYIVSTKKIKFKHNTCGHIWSTVPSVILRGGGCPSCYGNEVKTQEQFVKEVSDLVGEEYVVLGKYKNVKTKIEMKHNKCGHEYMVDPDKFTQGRRCPNCKSKLLREANLKSHEQFLIDIYFAVGDEYEVLSEYKGQLEKVTMKHSKCGYIWDVQPDRFLFNNTRCPKCNYNDRKKTTDEFKREVFKLVGIEYEVIGEYISSNEKVKLKHNVCGNTYSSTTASNFLRGTRCPLCIESRGEKIIREWLNSNDEISYLPQYRYIDCRNIKPLPFDFYIIDNKNGFLIEFDGRQHFNPSEKFNGEGGFIKLRENDHIKNYYCIKKNIPLLRIKHTAIDLVEKLIEQFIKDPISLNNTSIEDYYDNDKNFKYVVIGLSTKEKIKKNKSGLVLA